MPSKVPSRGLSIVSLAIAAVDRYITLFVGFNSPFYVLDVIHTWKKMHPILTSLYLKNECQTGVHNRLARSVLCVQNITFMFTMF